jgi:hypothetical protein
MFNLTHALHIRWSHFSMSGSWAAWSKSALHFWHDCPAATLSSMGAAGTPPASSSSRPADEEFEVSGERLMRAWQREYNLWHSDNSIQIYSRAAPQKK